MLQAVISGFEGKVMEESVFSRMQRMCENCWFWFGGARILQEVNA